MSFKPRVIALLKSYLAGAISAGKAREEVWEIIAEAERSSFLTVKTETAFWHALWTAQHVLDNEHEAAGVTAKELEGALAYLEGRAPLPKGLSALPPNTR